MKPAKKKTEKQKRSHHGRGVRQYYPFGDFLSTAAQTLTNYPDLREMLRRAVNDSELWDLLAETQQLEQKRKELTAKFHQIGARIRRAPTASRPVAPVIFGKRLK